MPEPKTPNQPHKSVALPGSREVFDPEQAARATKAISRALRRAATKSRAPTRIISGGGGFQARRGDRVFRQALLASFGMFVAVPLLIASIYWGLVASKQYVTETKFSLRSGENASLTMMTGGETSGSGQQMQDAQVVVKYILSRGLIEALDRKINLREKFSRPGVDYFSRFDADSPVEDLERYWKKRVDASVDIMSGIISVSVRAFTPEDSLLITQNVIDLSEALVNDLSTRARRDTLKQMRSELTRAEERLKAATAAMREARDAEGVLDAPAAAEALNKVITALRMELSTTEENLALQSGSATTDSPQVRLLNARVRSLKNQIAEYSAQIASTDDKNTSLAGRAGKLSQHEVETAIAQQQYAMAATAFENARIDLESQRAYLTTFLRPTLAEKSIYPLRWLEWSIIVAPAILVWTLLVAVAFLVRDHMAK